MYCSSCGEDIHLGVRFCNHCGSPTGSELMRGGEAAAADPDATRVADRDSEATRVASRAPFDERRGPPSRVERLPERNPAPALEEMRHDSRPAIAPPPPSPPLPTQASAAERRLTPEHDAERVIFTVRPTLLFVGLGYLIAALGAVGLTFLLATFNLLPALYSVLLSLPLLLIPAYYHLRRNSVRYTLTDAKIEIDQGFLSRRTRNIPLRNIQDVTVQATIPQRLMRFGDLIVDNANEVGGSTTMRNIPAPRRHADLLLRELRRWS